MASGFDLWYWVVEQLGERCDSGTKELNKQGLFWSGEK